MLYGRTWTERLFADPAIIQVQERGYTQNVIPTYQMATKNLGYTVIMIVSSTKSIAKDDYVPLRSHS
jgi:hypothetical protein